MAEPAFDGDGKILFRQFLNALIRVANVLARPPRRENEALTTSAARALSFSAPVSLSRSLRLLCHSPRRASTVPQLPPPR